MAGCWDPYMLPNHVNRLNPKVLTLTTNPHIRSLEVVRYLGSRHRTTMRRKLNRTVLPLSQLDSDSKREHKSMRNTRSMYLSRCSWQLLVRQKRPHKQFRSRKETYSMLGCDADLKVTIGQKNMMAVEGAMNKPATLQIKASATTSPIKPVDFHKANIWD